jgi:hypothetical protein
VGSRLLRTSCQQGRQRVPCHTLTVSFLQLLLLLLLLLLHRVFPASLLIVPAPSSRPTSPALVPSTPLPHTPLVVFLHLQSGPPPPPPHTTPHNLGNPPAAMIRSYLSTRRHPPPPGPPSPRPQPLPPPHTPPPWRSSCSWRTAS